MTQMIGSLSRFFVFVFIALLCLVGCATFSYVSQEPVVPAQAYSLEEGSRIEVVLAEVPALQEVGGAASIEDERLPKGLIIAQYETDKYVVASSQCTHRGKALSYNHDEKVFQCSALGRSRFGLDGSVLSGMADEPLEIYRAYVEDGVLVISLSD